MISGFMHSNHEVLVKAVLLSAYYVARGHTMCLVPCREE